MCFKEQYALFLLFIFWLNFSLQTTKVDNSSLNRYTMDRKCKLSADCEEYELCFRAIGLCVCHCQHMSENCKCDAKTNEIVIQLGVSRITNTITTSTSSRQRNEENKNISSKSENLAVKSYDIRNTTLTIGFGFGLPIILACFIILFFIYVLRKRYFIEINHYLYRSTEDDMNGDVISINETYREEFNLRTYEQSNYFSNGVTNNELATIENSYDENKNDKKPPPVYAHISDFSKVDKLPTYNSFKRKSKPNSFILY